ncbi:MAG: hypothetical protein KAT77_04070 [Nanoarchaeota archaeon]|nr:hypothetical protein [Nanoarchaeota archaeon]
MKVMDIEMIVKDIEIRSISNMWASVRAKRDFSKGEIIEVCPIAVLNQDESRLAEKTYLKNISCRYKRRLVVPGGYGSVYLPSGDPNTDTEVYPAERRMIIRANRKIREGKHIFVDRGVFSPSEPKWEYDEASPWCSEGLIVKPSPSRGLGTFTTREFKKGEYAEICHLFSLTRKQSDLLKNTSVNGFMYALGSRNRISGWAIGYPCFYNHSDEPNIDPWNEIESIEEDHLAVKVLKDLGPNTELVFDYLPGYKKEKKDLGFKIK